MALRRKLLPLLSGFCLPGEAIYGVLASTSIAGNADVLAYIVTRSLDRAR